MTDASQEFHDTLKYGVCFFCEKAPGKKSEICLERLEIYGETIRCNCCEQCRSACENDFLAK